MPMDFKFEELKSSQKAIIELLYSETQELSADQIFLLLNQKQKTFSYACVYNNIRLLKQQKLLTTTTQIQGKYPSLYQLTGNVEQQITHRKMKTNK